MSERSRDAHIVRLKVKAKLADGLLPREFLPQMLGESGNGLRCDACNEIIPDSELAIEGSLAKGDVVRFHVECFTIWEKVREEDSRDGAGRA